MKRTLALALSALSIIAVGCDDDGGGKAGDAGAGKGGGGAGGAGGLNLSIDKTKKVNDLSADEREKACRELQAWSDKFGREIAPKVCEIGVVLAILQQGRNADINGCRDAVSACGSAAPPDAGANGDNMDMCAAVQTNCTATVGEVEKCTNDNVAAVNKYVKLWPTCTELEDGDATIPLQTARDPESCTSIKPKCPDLPLLSELFGQLLSR